MRRPSAAADERRKEISDRKRQEERDQDAGETPFARFADAWNAKEPELWIGPDGLFLVEERQKARAFYSDYLTKEFRDADQALANSDPLGVENALKRLQLRSDVFAPDLLSEAIARNPNARSDWEQRLSSAIAVARDDASVDEVQREWEAWRDIPSNHVVTPYKSLPFFTDTWPFDKQRAIIFNDQIKPQPLPQAIAASFLRYLLGEASSSIVSEPQLEQPVEAKLSGPSRLAFRVPPQRRFSLSLQALTDWRDLELSVVQRARRLHQPQKNPGPNESELVDDIAEVLRSEGILPGDHSGPDRLRQIQATLAPPGPYHTSLEIPSRLFLSPAQDVRFVTAKFAPKQDDVINPIWQARLVEDRFPASLRAIWSPDFDPAAFDPDPAKQRHPQPGLYPNFDDKRSALDLADRHDFVSLSSVYGLPVIVTKGSPKRPNGYEFEGDNETDPKGAGPQGIYTPVALATRLLTLSSLGGTLDHDTSFPPFTAWRDSGGVPLFASSSLQRWRSLIVDGRDVITTVVRRGYLFPLGHRGPSSRLPSREFVRASLMMRTPVTWPCNQREFT